MSVDYLKPAGRAARVFSLVGCIAATAVCLLFVAVATVGLRRSNASVADQKIAWFIIVFFGLIGCATSALGYRLARGSISNNGVTTMPVWFIQAFGMFLLVGAIFVGVSGGKWINAVEGASLALAMLFIGRKLAMQRKNEPNKAVQHNDPSCHGSCLRTPRASRDRG